MTEIELARLQFGITTVYHFLFVPVTIGLSMFVALCQTLWYRTGKDVYLRMTRFWAKPMLVIFAVGVATGIVQEFQFGMNWSTYSRYVGDVFGAPLAMEGLAAFFVESTFLGLWLFGWGRLSPRVHLATAWAFSGATALSAFFILAANSWMQHPVGYELNAVTGRAEMTSIWRVLTNSTVLYAFPHTILGAFTTAGMVVLAICAWNFLRGRHLDVFGSTARLALPITLVAALLTAGVGHFQGTLMVKQQPMKMAAAEALFDTERGAGLSVFATGDFTRDPGHTNRNLKIPHLLSVISDMDPNSTVRGINDIERDYTARYGPGQYVPVVAVTYWSFRAMIGAGIAMILLTAVGVWLMRRGRLSLSPRWARLMLAGAALPFIANTAGWVFTEMGRQPWVVQGLLKTGDAVSPSVSSAEVAISLIGFTVVYGVLAAIAARVVLKIVRTGPPDASPPGAGAGSVKPDLALTY
jgi:cytochrome d ubiquinol oxidase subunit I